MLRVNGGPANSGTVIKREAPAPWWFHNCTIPDPSDETQPYLTRGLRGYWSRCPDCGAKRP